MKQIEVYNGRIYFVSGKDRYIVTVLGGEFMVEVAEGNILTSNNKSELMKKKLKKI
jgi:hypothetical protein